MGLLVLEICRTFIDLRLVQPIQICEPKRGHSWQGDLNSLSSIYDLGFIPSLAKVMSVSARKCGSDLGELGCGIFFLLVS